MIPPPLRSTLFPYTTLFRSWSFILGFTVLFAAVNYAMTRAARSGARSEEHTSELQSRRDLVCRLLLDKKKSRQHQPTQSGTCTPPSWPPTAALLARPTAATP